MVYMLLVCDAGALGDMPLKRGAKIIPAIAGGVLSRRPAPGQRPVDKGLARVTHLVTFCREQVTKLRTQPYHTGIAERRPRLP